MQKEEKYFTYASLGFAGVRPMTKPKAPSENKYYNTLIIKRPKNNIVAFLTNEIVEYSKHQGYLSLKGRFVAGLAYMRDKSVVMVYNRMENENEIACFLMPRDYYKRAPIPEGIHARSNIEYLEGMINAREPEALCILQEIPSPNPTMYHFRIVHDKESDVISGSIIEFPKEPKRR